MKKAHQIFKYLVYSAVLSNVFLFFRKELKAAIHRFGEDISIFQIFEAFTSTLDTAAWVVLLILFEIQTYILPKEKNTPLLKRIFTGLRGLCFIVIFSSFLGYIQGFNWLKSFEESTISQLCEVVDQSWMQEIDNFKLIEEKECSTLAKGTKFFKHSEKSVYTDDYYLKATKWLSSVEVLNSLSWILIVLLLEIDVWLMRKSSSTKSLTLNQYFKNSCYFLLLFCAIYWGVYGDFLEFWDAFLWIVAFVFIELNISSADIFGRIKKLVVHKKIPSSH